MKLILNLKKHAQQDNTKVLGAKPIMSNICWKKAKQMLRSVSFGLIISELRELCTVLNSGVLLFETRHY